MVKTKIIFVKGGDVKKRSIVIFVVVIILVSVSTVVGYVYYQKESKQKIIIPSGLDRIKEKADFLIYVPRYLPNNFAPTPEGAFYSEEKHRVVWVYQSKDRILVVRQDKMNEETMKHLEQTIVSSQQFDVNGMTAIIGRNKLGSQIAYWMTDNVIIQLSSSSISVEELTQIARSMQPF